MDYLLHEVCSFVGFNERHFRRVKTTRFLSSSTSFSMVNNFSSIDSTSTAAILSPPYIKRIVDMKYKLLSKSFIKITIL